MNNLKVLFINIQNIILRRKTQYNIRFINSLVGINNDLKVLEPGTGDVSDITPYFPESFNVAAYINSSETLQQLLKLNVDFNKIEKKPHLINKILQLDFEKDIKNHVLFMKDYVRLENMGKYISKNPLILCEPLEDLEIRINYLKSKKFTYTQIQQVIMRNPFWLMFSTLRIDKRLGFFQQKFDLCGNEIRKLSTKQPRIVTYNCHHINTATFVIKEEMGFNEEETKFLILQKPNLWMISHKSLIERFNYLHNIIKIPHSTILQYPNVLLCRNFKVRQRHLFLKSMGRDQFDCSKENYIPIKALVENTDLDFCKNYAKSNIDDFNMFLKTM